MGRDNEFRGPTAGIAIVLGGLFIAFLAATSCFVVVDAGHVGVVKRLGAVQSTPLQEGFHFKIPFADKVRQIDTRLMRSQASAASASRDLQIVETQVTLQFSLSGEVAPKTYQRVGNERDVANNIVEPAIQESVKAITAQYTAEQLVTQRAEVKVQIQQAIDEFIDKTLKEKKVVNAVTIANVAITDFAFSAEFNRAIEMKVKAEQEALQAKNEKIRRVTQAEAGAAERKLAAEAEAYEIEVSSKARAAAIKREAEALTDNPELIELRTIERWDGTLPKFMGSSGVPFLSVDKLVGGK